ncbi:MAG: hypothetical protein RSE41_01095 [Clostridia bacterium]
MQDKFFYENIDIVFLLFKQDPSLFTSVLSSKNAIDADGVIIEVTEKDKNSMGDDTFEEIMWINCPTNGNTYELISEVNASGYKPVRFTNLKSNYEFNFTTGGSDKVNNNKRNYPF